MIKNKSPPKTNIPTPNYNQTKALRNKTQLQLTNNIFGNTGVNPERTHGFGIWGNPRVPMCVRVDKGLKKQFTLASKALFGSTCNPIESYMATIVGFYNNQTNLWVNPSNTKNPVVNIGEIKIERNLRERRKLVVDPKRVDNCMIGSCGKVAVDTGLYKGQEFRLCGFHAEAYAGCKGWSFL